MRDEDIHIGDMVRVRQWYDLANEYGENCHLVEGLFEPSNKAYDIPIHAKKNLVHSAYGKVLRKCFYSVRGIFIRRCFYRLQIPG